MERERDAKEALRSNPMEAASFGIVRSLNAFRAGSCTTPITRVAGSSLRSLGARRKGNAGTAFLRANPSSLTPLPPHLPTFLRSPCLWLGTLVKSSESMCFSMQAANKPRDPSSGKGARTPDDLAGSERLWPERRQYSMCVAPRVPCQTELVHPVHHFRFLPR
jgi:hypothetical protein